MNIQELFISNLREQSTIYNNIIPIFEKSKKEKYTKIIHKSINKIFEKEIKSAKNQIKKLDNKNFNFKEILKKNIFVFKESLKLILKTSSILKSRNNLAIFINK